ncbi:hypothetical protein C731_3033 [Mycolicibacterium hassiacum DSM 44199]|uniref:Uncharacterized protein n=1 Tax=Mycolicibacterium hassiacum (strain DSM 44199 / CIP 105218 / JCM 12690 / 3849) TaxID=1122247 RepID=K5B839_MYCHD|nr:hypothetical protein [Mycolicibacterium hassiacum]EKF23028.1 hypothetical protein C731_3033 [Mycolicibacterium hassiacum DSM 44199]MBX5487759.1 hypothetical protein [Mycolicibacterium hassiacum]MDA4085982.1 hypothetical protein [Mycolicibacterium hassiacum DSM 44199]PZN13858.1 MAG: hypothetical protein DIU75_22210 [Mycolicibacterium hassiacum]VCT89440.1 hypothetical protein MHAS_01133 [Mycolicibacterium hassiacum DSM 44199]
MDTALIHTLVGAVPLGVTLILIFLIYGVGKNRKGPHEKTYNLSEPWTHGPILWAAEEPAAHGHGAHGGDHQIVGGGASGKW